MTSGKLMPAAAEMTTRVVAGVTPEQLDGPTPCPEYDVRTLVNHIGHWTGERAEKAARKQPQTPLDPSYDPIEAVGGLDKWSELYDDQARAAAEAWTEPSASEGETGVSGEGKMPAGMIAGILFAEYLLHGWDLAVATGQPFDPEPPLAEELLTQMNAFADMARAGGSFGPAVEVPPDAPPFHQALGLAGRTPTWQPS
ncbi:TIGR03086 family metal-binding protein [Kribbella sp. NBC_01245]|uniref:TIGR03086 family metal-binding protein n=1 Tax=Kribbella sp. NBC_01245 TaxID=2903578 RepID=UPI002E2B6DFC|nr:TIGR03086 family metal-binding protein [Kribbella sp. NBC_01245]